MYGQFVRERSKTTDEKKKKITRKWLRKTDLMIETEALMCVAQRAGDLKNYVKHKIYTTVGSPLCKMCVKNK